MRISFDVFGNKINPGQFFFGGGGGAPPKQEPVKIPTLPAQTMPKPLPPPKPIPPVPTTSNQEVQQQSEDQKRQQAARRGIASTLIAGNKPAALASATTGQKTLLG